MTATTMGNAARTIVIMTALVTSAVLGVLAGNALQGAEITFGQPAADAVAPAPPVEQVDHLQQYLAGRGEVQHIDHLQQYLAGRGEVQHVDYLQQYLADRDARAVTDKGSRTSPTPR